MRESMGQAERFDLFSVQVTHREDAWPEKLTSHCTCSPTCPPRPMSLLQKQHMGSPCRSRSVHPDFQPLWVVDLGRLEFGLGKICNPGPWPPLRNGKRNTWQDSCRGLPGTEGITGREI